MVSSEFFVDIIRPVTLWPCSRLSFWEKWVPEIFPGGKGGRCLRLITLPLLYDDCLEIWEPQPLSGPVQACNGIALPLPYVNLYWSKLLVYNRSILNSNLVIETSVSNWILLLLLANCFFLRQLEGRLPFLSCSPIKVWEIPPIIPALDIPRIICQTLNTFGCGQGQIMCDVTPYVLVDTHRPVLVTFFPFILLHLKIYVWNFIEALAPIL